MTRRLVLLLAALAPSEPQDRADLQLPIESWSRVVQGTRPIGYVHEVMRRASPPWRYEYGLEAEFELTVRGKTHSEDLVATALLDDTLAPVEFLSEGHVGDASSSLSIVTVGEERRLEGRPLGASEPVAWALAAGDEGLVLPWLAMIVLRQNESLSRPGRLTRRALDPEGKERDGIQVDLEVGAPVHRPYLGKECAVLPVRFLKPFPSVSPESEMKDAFVDRYGRIVEAVLAGGARIILAADRTEALAGVGLVHRHGRRDPFDKAAAMKNAALERARAARGELEVPKPVVTLQSLDSDLAAAAKRIEEVRNLRSSGDLEEARRLYLQTVVELKSIRELALLRRPDLLGPVERMRDDAEAAWDGAAQVEREARRVYVGLRDQVDRLDLLGLERTGKDLGLLRDRVEVERRPERERIADWTAEAEALLGRCRTRLELAQARLDVTGITLAEIRTEEDADSRLRPFGIPMGAVQKLGVARPIAMANVNGRLVRRGDLIEGTSIRVADITAMGVQFSLRDELRDVGLRR